MIDILERGWLSFANSVWLTLLLTFTGDFTRWKEHDACQKAFTQLLHDLQTTS